MLSERMASDEHKALATFIKNVHSHLRQSTASTDFNSAWRDHCNNTELLTQYAISMEKLSSTYWLRSSTHPNKTAQCRIEWSASNILNYFTNTIKHCRDKESAIAEKMGLHIDLPDVITRADKIHLLDVGSCFNPFQSYDYLDVTAIDLCPANDRVLKCDFLSVDIGHEFNIAQGGVKQLQLAYYDAVTFCFVLEYLPSSEQRILACQRAYDVLKCEGVMVICTPDSKHVGANCKIMKSWRYTMSKIGFSRIKYDKFPHMHCMIFRKSLRKEIPERWATLYREPYMTFDLKIPQDFTKQHEQSLTNCMRKFSDISIVREFNELPFVDVSD